MGGITIASKGAHTAQSRSVESAASGFTVLRAPHAEPPVTTLVPVGRAPLAAPELVEVRAVRKPVVVEHDSIAAVHPDAHRFVLSTMRALFEVLDRRRPAKHLKVIASGTVMDVLKALSETERRPVATATTWGRVHVAPPRALPQGVRTRAGELDPELGAEVFLTYRRGERVLAAAGRVESTGGRWRWVAFTTAA